MREFGLRASAQPYIPRPGAYAVVLNTLGRVAVVRTHRATCLPGGGVEPGEPLEAALRREVLEECGLEVTTAVALCEAVEYVDAGPEGCFAKQCTFFRVGVGARVVGPGEADHVLEWLPIRSAVEMLTFRSQVWAVSLLLDGEETVRPPSTSSGEPRRRRRPAPPPP